MATGVCEFAAAGISAATKLEVEKTTQHTMPASPAQAPFKNSFSILITPFPYQRNLPRTLAGTAIRNKADDEPFSPPPTAWAPRPCCLGNGRDVAHWEETGRRGGIQTHGTGV